MPSRWHDECVGDIEMRSLARRVNASLQKSQRNGAVFLAEYAALAGKNVQYAEFGVRVRAVALDPKDPPLLNLLEESLRTPKARVDRVVLDGRQAVRVIEFDIDGSGSGNSNDLSFRCQYALPLCRDDSSCSESVVVLSFATPAEGDYESMAVQFERIAESFRFIGRRSRSPVAARLAS